jgi:hypothetical protein
VRPFNKNEEKAFARLDTWAGGPRVSFTPSIRQLDCRRKNAGISS